MVGQKGNEDLFRYILKASKEMGDEEKRFQFVRSQINSLEDCMEEGPNKHATIKSLANWAVKEFTAMEKFKTDKRMLDIWKLMGKYSENMGMDGVLENLHRIGFFKDCPEFYLMWAEHWAVKGKLENFNKTMQICKENCPLSPSEAKEMFKPLLIKYFDLEMENSNSMDGKTMDLIKMLADKPEDIRPELTLFPYERTIAPDPKHKDDRKSQMLDGFEHQRQQRESMPPATTTTANREEFSVFKEKSQMLDGFEHQRQQRESMPAATTTTANREEFSVFKDPTSVIHHQPTQTQFMKQNVQQEEPPLQKSTEQKEMDAPPKKTASAEELQPIEPMNNPSNAKTNVDKNQSKMHSENYGRRQSFIPDLNDVTVAGSHGKFSSAMLTSTPRRSINPLNFDPVYALSPQKNAEQLFFDDLEESINKEGGGLFGGVGVGTSSNKEPMAGGSSKLQKRLSLLVSETPQQQIRMEQPQNPVPETQQTKRTSRPSDIIKTMPKLKIGSTIEEVSEEKENTTNTNSIFNSPFRKKSKLVGGGDDPSKSQLIGAEKQLVDKDESTHTGLVVEKIKIGTINPWDEQLRREFLARSPAMSECYQLPSNKCPRLELNRTINLGGEQFHIDKLLGEGGFARVYKAKSLDNKQYYAIKYESPPCPWEVYICASLRRRFQPKFLDFVMQIREAYIFSNASAIVYDYYPYGSLLDLSNMYKKNGAGEMNGLLATYFGIQLGRILEQVHAANIIHGDVKPDNIMLTIANLDERKSLDQLLSVGAPSALKLIDWGRSIDMEQFPAGQEFIGRAGTENFDCYEMTCGMPWTYQTDFYGFVASIYVLLRGEYLQTFKFADDSRIIPKTPLKRRMALYDLWQYILGQFLNIPNCKELPKWAEMNRQMEEGLKTAVETELGLEWKKAVERFNAFMKQQMNG